MPIPQHIADQWTTCMRRTLDQLAASDDTRALIDNAFVRVSNAMLNSPG
jgi:truncated hemoglobin YjbI